MLNPKEKALELFNKFGSPYNTWALLAVDEIILVESNYYPNEIDYWIEVKHEIINL
jgi:hypothetical protein